MSTLLLATPFQILQHRFEIDDTIHGIVEDVGWTVETLNDTVDGELADLPEEMQARFVRIAELIEAVGLPNVREPHVKHIRDSIWEIRLKGTAGIARALYVTATGKRVVVVRVFAKKTQKTPNTEIEIARERAKELEK
jgi:phage-related protein